MVAWLNNPMTKGILIGVGVSAVAFYAYKKNEAKVDSFMRNHGINVKTPTPDFKTMSVDDLMRTKENIEDLIAEKEMQEQEVKANDLEPAITESNQELSVEELTRLMEEAVKNEDYENASRFRDMLKAKNSD